MNQEMRPTGHLRTMGNRWPGIWKVLWGMRDARGKQFPDWPDWCFVPLRITQGVASRVPVGPTPSYPGEDTAARDAPRLGALAAWRATQGIYRFDPDVFAAAWETPLTGRIPVGVLKRVPEWCLYVETPGVSWPFWGSMAGFYAYLDPGLPDRPETLWIVLDFEEQPWDLTLIPFSVPLDAPTVEEAVERLVRRAERAGAEEAHMAGEAAWRNHATRSESVAEIQGLTRRLAHPLSLLLYLCSASAEYEDASGSGRSPGRPEPRRTRKGPKLFPPDRPTVWETGYRMGAALRAARKAAGSAENGRGAAPRPHFRRAHWHGYWTGPKRVPEEREFVYKWLPPIAVNVRDVEDLIPTVRPVE